MNYRSHLLVLCFAFLCACATQPGGVADRATVAVTWDGMQRVTDTRADEAWAKPNVTFSQYTKILPIAAGIAYQTPRNRNDFPLSAAQKQRLQSVLDEVFAAELKQLRGYAYVEEPGPDVLILEAGLIDVVSNVPPERPSRSEFYLSNIGAATLVIELRDSLSGEILVRAIDRRVAEPVGGGLAKSSSATNLAEVRREARRWAVSLRENLEALRKL